MVDALTWVMVVFLVGGDDRGEVEGDIGDVVNLRAGGQACLGAGGEADKAQAADSREWAI